MSDAPEHAPETPTGLGRVFSVDHKVIARQFLFLGLAFLAVMRHKSKKGTRDLWTTAAS